MYSEAGSIILATLAPGSCQHGCRLQATSAASVRRRVPRDGLTANQVTYHCGTCICRFRQRVKVACRTAWKECVPSCRRRSAWNDSSWCCKRPCCNCSPARQLSGTGGALPSSGSRRKSTPIHHQPVDEVRLTAAGASITGSGRKMMCTPLGERQAAVTTWRAALSRERRQASWRRRGRESSCRHRRPVRSASDCKLGSRKLRTSVQHWLHAVAAAIMTAQHTG